MKDATSKQISQTLANMTAEVRDNGITEAASDMWLHALTMYRKHKLGVDTTDVPQDTTALPMFLRPQAH